MRAIFSVLLFSLSAPLLADEPKPSDAEATAKAVAPFLDNQTLAVAHFRVERVTPATIERIADIVGWLPAERKQVLARREQWVGNLVSHNVSDIFLIFSFADARSPLAWIIPAGGPAKARQIGKEFGSLHPALTLGLESDRKDSTALFGSKTMLQHLKTMTPAARPDVTKAFVEAGDGDVQVLLVPPGDSRRVIAEMMPTFSPELGGGTTKPLSQGLRWATLAATFSPKMALKVIVQASDADLAQKLGELQGRAFKLFGELKGDDDKPLANLFGGEFDKVAQMLTAKVTGDRLVLNVGDEALTQGMAKLAARMSDAVQRRERMEDLKNLAIAMHNYHDTYGRFPARAGYGKVDVEELKKKGVEFPDLTTKPDKDSKPLLSWRVYLLPYIEQLNLFQEFHLDEPWDSEHNKKLIARIPPSFRGGRPRDDSGRTRILAPIIKGAIFEPDGHGTQIRDIVDGTSNTIMFVEAAEDQAVIWTKPDDLIVDAQDTKKGLFGPEATYFLAALADGSPKVVPKKIAPRMLLNLFIKNDGNIIQWPD